jgi:hypothetical protein
LEARFRASHHDEVRAGRSADFRESAFDGAAFDPRGRSESIAMRGENAKIENRDWLNDIDQLRDSFNIMNNL